MSYKHHSVLIEGYMPPPPNKTVTWKLLAILPLSHDASQFGTLSTTQIDHSNRQRFPRRCFLPPVQTVQFGTGTGLI